MFCFTKSEANFDRKVESNLIDNKRKVMEILWEERVYTRNILFIMIL